MSMKQIKLWKNRKELSDKVAIVDDEDYDRVMEAISSRSKWYACSPPTSKKYYAMGGHRDLSIHRVVMKAPKGMDVDHINGDPLDNRKENLRLCSRSENCRNKKVRADSKSGFKGVEYVKNPRYEKFLKHGPILNKDGSPRKNQPRPYKKPWRAYIGNPNKISRHMFLGSYETPEEAAKAYDKKAIELHGEFAYLNFPKDKK
jgi:hypothetical protein